VENLILQPCRLEAPLSAEPQSALVPQLTRAQILAGASDALGRRGRRAAVKACHRLSWLSWPRQKRARQRFVTCFESFAAARHVTAPSAGCSCSHVASGLRSRPSPPRPPGAGPVLLGPAGLASALGARGAQASQAGQGA